MCEPKEPEYFSRDDVFAMGDSYYRGLFSSAPSDAILGEASSTYSRWPHTPDVPARIRDAAPGMKFIYIMREPVSRAYSHYAHHMRDGVRMSFEEAIERDSIYVDCGMYMRQIERYLEHFDRAQFLFLLQDDLRADPRSVVRSMMRFIGAPEADLLAQGHVHANRISKSDLVRRMIRKRIAAFPLGSKALEWTPDWVRDAGFRAASVTPIVRRLEDRFEVPPMAPETRARLRALFERPTRELGEFLDRDLGCWAGKSE